MSETDSQSGRTDGGKVECDHCGELFDPRGVKQHEASCDGSQREDSSKDESGVGLLDHDREWWESHGGTVLDLQGREPRDGETVGTSAARSVIKKYEANEQGRTLFGECRSEGCGRWTNGFDSDYCGKPSHSESETDGGSSDGGSNDSSNDDISLDDLSDDDKQKLVAEVVENL
jgi:hypothetical protein